MLEAIGFEDERESAEGPAECASWEDDGPAWEEDWEENKSEEEEA